MARLPASASPAFRDLRAHLYAYMYMCVCVCLCVCASCTAPSFWRVCVPTCLLIVLLILHVFLRVLMYVHLRVHKIFPPFFHFLS